MSDRRKTFSDVIGAAWNKVSRIFSGRENDAVESISPAVDHEPSTSTTVVDAYGIDRDAAAATGVSLQLDDATAADVPANADVAAEMDVAVERETAQDHGARDAQAADGVAAEEHTVDEAGPTPVDRAASTRPVQETGTPVVGTGVLVLQLETARGQARTFELTRSGATLGRGPDNTIRIDDLSVSRRHARITYRQGAYWLSDLRSASGTWLDGTRLKGPRPISPGQVIEIGICRLLVAAASDAERKDTASRTD